MHPYRSPAPLAGVQLKFVMHDTFACDQCWSDYEILRRAYAPRESL